MSPAAIALCRARGCTALADGNLANASAQNAYLVSLPDGRLVSLTSTGRVALWTGGHRGPPMAEVQIEEPMQVCALAVLPDGHRIAIARRWGHTAPSGIAVWDTRDAARVAIPTTIGFANGTGMEATALAALPNGQLAVGFAYGMLCIVDVEAKAVVATLEGHVEKVTTLVVLSYVCFASGSWSSTVKLWDVTARVCTARLRGHEGPVISMVVLTNGQLASAASDKTVRLWDVGSRTCVGALPVHARNLAVLSGSNRLGVLTYDEKLLMWDTRDAAGGEPTPPTLTVELVGAGYGVTALVPLPGGRLATGGHGMRLWQLLLDDVVQAPL